MDHLRAMLHSVTLNSNTRATAPPTALYPACGRKLLDVYGPVTCPSTPDSPPLFVSLFGPRNVSLSASLAPQRILPLGIRSATSLARELQALSQENIQLMSRLSGDTSRKHMHRTRAAFMGGIHLLSTKPQQKVLSFSPKKLH